MKNVTDHEDESVAGRVKNVNYYRLGAFWSHPREAGVNNIIENKTLGYCKNTRQQKPEIYTNVI